MTTGLERFSKMTAAAPTILPSLLQCDFGNLEREVERLEEAGVAGLHLDVMDGVFVPNFTYGITIVAALRKLTDLPLDVHLMMVNPDHYIDQFCEAGADVLTVHAEACDDLPSVIEQIKNHQVAAGVAVNPPTPVSTFAEMLPLMDLALVMSVNAGFGGQSFMPEVLEKYIQIRQLPGGDSVVLEIDGGINEGTVASASEGGAQLLVAGSAIFNQDDYTAAIENLMSHVSVGGQSND